MENKIKINLLISGVLVAVLLVGLWLTFHFLGFNLMQSDVVGYWKDSLNISTPFNAYHVPLYPIVIFLLRTLSANILQPIIYMQAITIVSLFFSSYFVFRIITGNKKELTNVGFGLLIAWIYILWPFEGLTSVIFPISDQFAFCLFLAGLFFVLQKKLGWGFALWGLSLVAHKALWPFVILCAIAAYFDNRVNSTAEDKIKQDKWFLYTLYLLVPILLLWVSGAIVNHDVFWIVKSNLQTEMMPKSQYPLLDGFISSFHGSMIKVLVKGGSLLATLLLSIFGLWVSIKNRHSLWMYGIAISTPVIILILILNQGEIWAAYRFGRLLVLPIGWFALENLGKMKINPTLFKSLSIFLLIFFAISQFAFAWYMASVFYAS